MLANVVLRCLKCLLAFWQQGGVSGTKLQQVKETQPWACPNPLIWHSLAPFLETEVDTQSQSRYFCSKQWRRIAGAGGHTSAASNLPWLDIDY